MPSLPFDIGFITPKLILVLLGMIVFLLYWIFNFTIIYHLARFGVGTLPKKLAAIFMLGSIILFFITISLSAGVNVDAVKSRLTIFAESATGSFGAPNFNYTQ
jgi:hypothetical protein